jgi:trehalose-phosphatase
LQSFGVTDNAFEPVERLFQAIHRHRNDLIFVLLGFDGVLAEYHNDPDAVRLSPTRRDLLFRLIGDPDITLGVVSGRRVGDLRQRVGLNDEVFYIGLHGLEAVGPRFTRVERQAFGECRELLREISAAAGPLISQIGGAHLEDKEAVLALHTREANSSDAVWARLYLLSRVSEIAGPLSFRVLRGSHVLELLPNIGATKAAAITSIRDFLEQRDGRRVFTVYVGEDLADDDAHEAVASNGIAAVVGRRATRVDHHLESTEMIDQLLVRLSATDSQADQPH